MSGETVCWLFEFYIAPLYMDVPVKILRKPISERLWGLANPQSDNHWIAVRDDLEGRKLLGVLFHELAHLLLRCKLGYETEQITPPGDHLDRVMAMLGVQNDPALVDAIVAGSDRDEETMCDEFAARELAKWWPILEQARTSRENWRRFVNWLDTQLHGEVKPTPPSADRLLGEIEAVLLADDVQQELRRS